MKEVVIIGGGFAGINLAKHLDDSSRFHITLVDRNNYYFFPPLLYQVATAYLDPSNISYPFRKLFRKHPNVSFRMAEFKEVKPEENKVILSNGELNYDILVFCTGTETNYFGMENVRKNSLPMKTVNNALELRNHYLQIYEQASITTDLAELKKLLTIVVVGGGPTGVELSGMLSEMKKHIIPKDYPEITKKNYESHIYLVDGLPQVLNTMTPASQRDTHKALEKMGVEIKLNWLVKDYSDDKLTFANGEVIESKTVIWAAGVTTGAFNGMPAESIGHAKRLIADEFHKVKGMKNIYAIGDSSIQVGIDEYPKGHPQLAQVAIQGGASLANNLAAESRGKAMKPFKYFDKGTMAIIGTNKAVADLPKPKLHFKGFIAWFMWVFIHLISLVNYRNRIRTLYNWVGAYFTRDQSMRMIIRPEKEEKISNDFSTDKKVEKATAEVTA